MTENTLRQAIESAHQKLAADAHDELFPQRLLELRQFVEETVQIAQKEGDLAARQHAIRLLELPHYDGLNKLLVAVPEIWAQNDMQSVEPEEFVNSMRNITQAYPKLFNLPDVATDEPTAAKGMVYEFKLPTGVPELPSNLPELDMPPLITRGTQPATPDTTFLPKKGVADPYQGENADDLRERALLRPVIEEIFDQRKTLELVREITPILAEALEEFGRHADDALDQEQALEVMRKQRYKASPALMSLIRDDDVLRSIFNGKMANLRLCLEVMLDVAQEHLPELAAK